MTNNPKISIGMPVYNGHKYIKDALDSLLAQTFTNFEIIISDNASTDETQAICEKYAANDKRIRYIRQSENIGSINNFQFVLNESIGTYFMWAAHDDQRDCRFLEMCNNILDRNEKVGLVSSFSITKNLQNLKTTTNIVGFSVSSNKFMRYLFRLSNPDSLMVYGLFRKKILVKKNMSLFDYSDIHLTHWFELNSNIVIIPLFLTIIGTDGIRTPYSLTGNYICYKTFLAKEFKLLRNHFSRLTSLFLIVITFFLFRKTTKAHNLKIKLNESCNNSFKIL